MDGNKVVNAQNLAELAKKIKEGGGSEQHLYWHTVLVQGTTDYASMITNKSFAFYCIILSTDNTPLTAQSFADLVIGADGVQFLTFSSWIEISGTLESRVEVSYVQKHSAARVRIIPINSNNYGTFGVNQIGYISDAVNQIF